jgi:hypothetical protein
MSVLTSLTTLSQKPKVITLADPDDILSEDPKWSAAQLLIPIEHRGEPAYGFKYTLLPEATRFDFTTRRLTAKERDVCNKIIESIPIPEKTEQRRSGVPGEPPITVRVGFDDEDPGYVKQLKEAALKQQALICLMGVEGLMEEVEGANAEEKIEKLRSTLDERLIRILYSEVWNRTYVGGDSADVFTSANSGSTTQS